MRSIALPAAVLFLSQWVSVDHVEAAERAVYCGTKQWRNLIDEVAGQFALPSLWVDAILRVESAGCATTNGLPTTSSAGAMGLMQLMPTTWLRLRGELRLGLDPFDPHDNILAGTAYLRKLYDRYGLPGAITAYHSGPDRYEAHIWDNRPLPDSTLNYLSRVMDIIDSQTQAEPLFVRHPFDAGLSDGTLRSADASIHPLTPRLRNRIALTPSRDLFIPLKHSARQSDASSSDPLRQVGPPP